MQHYAPAASYADDDSSPEGDPTDAALLRSSCDVPARERTRLEAEVTRVLPFDRERRIASVVVSSAAGVTSYTHGAPEAVLARVTARFGPAGTELPVGPDERAEVEALVNEWARKGLRVIALARCATGALGLEQATLCGRTELMSRSEQNLVLVGLLGLADPPRSEVAAALRASAGRGRHDHHDHG